MYMDSMECVYVYMCTRLSAITTQRRTHTFKEWDKGEKRKEDAPQIERGREIGWHLNVK